MALAIDKLTHLRIPLEDIRKATDNFHEDNIISSGGFGPAYKGRLLWSGEWIKIAARRLDPRYGRGDYEFWTEVSMLSDLKHPNIVSMIGYCDEEGEKIIITEHVVKGSLSQFLNNPTLTWKQRLQICVGVARVMSYLHLDHERNYVVIHRNINSYTILLDENWEPKLSGFEISIKQSVNRMDQVILSEPVGEEEYMDPEIEKTRGVTYKSDLYSFGIVLFELLCERLAVDACKFLAPLARNQYENKTLHDIIHPDLRDQMSPWSLVKYSKSAYSCTEEEQAYRPNIVNILGELNEALEFQSTRENFGKHLEHLKIPLTNIESGTENFSERCKIKANKIYAFYRAELHHFDKEFCSNVDGKKRDKISQRQNTVTIKRLLISNNKLREEVFNTNIQMLTSVTHPKIITLLGFCFEGSEMILVIKNPSNGYLRANLKDFNKRSLLTWEKRLKICIDVAQALNYIHSGIEEQKIIINRDIRSDCIMLDDNNVAKIAEFRLAVVLPPNQDDTSLHLDHALGIQCYRDPEYERTFKLKRESDVYGFGVVLFEILFGRLANDPIYLKESDKGLAFVARRCFNMGTLKDMIDPLIKEDFHENNFILNRGPNKGSLRTFVVIAYKCVAETQDQRPTMKVVLKQLEEALFLQEEHIRPDMEVVVDELEKALKLNRVHQISDKRLESLGMKQFVEEQRKPLEFQLQEKNLEHLKIPLTHIQLATNNFSNIYNIKRSHFCALYRAELPRFDKEFHSFVDGKNKDKIAQIHHNAIIKCFNDNKDAKETFYKELNMLTSVNHPNTVSLLGFCVEGLEMIIVVENLSNGYLSDALNNVNNKRILTWEKRLKFSIGVAQALNYIHSEMEGINMIINCNVGSYNITLDENWEGKIFDFGLSVFLSPDQDNKVVNHDVTIGKRCYIDPEYWKSGKLNRDSDVYGFGVVLFELLFGRLAYDPIYLKESDKGLAFVATRCFNIGTLQEMIDPLIKDKIGESNFILNKGPNKDSMRAYIEIANECVTETQEQRPTMKIVLKQLQKALFLQKSSDNLCISLEDIKLATHNFHIDKCIGGGGFGKVYKGKLQDSDVHKIIVAKRLDTRLGQGEQQFLGEIQILLEYKHTNIIGLVGYCDEKGEKIIAYEYASRGSLDRYLHDVRLTWMTRLKICIEIASALDFLHGGAGKQAKVVHRDIKTANILLNDEWKAKLADFGLSLISSLAQETDYIINRPCGTRGYVDPLYEKSKFLTIKSDIYSFGVVLFEILCGRSTFTIYKQEGVYLPDFVNNKFEEGRHDEVVFKEIREQVMSKSLTTFQDIAYQCLQHESEKRPTTSKVLLQLKKALEFQNKEDASREEEISSGD